MRNNYMKFGIFILMLHVVFSCKKENVPLTGLELSKSAVFLNLGTQDTLVAKILPKDATEASVTWFSSDTSIAKVDHEGVVTTIATGHAIISAKSVDNKYSSSCAIHVTKWSMIDLKNLFSFSFLTGSQINCMAYDSKGNLWIGGPSLYKFDGLNWTTFLQNDGISAITEDTNGNLWFGTYGYGIFKFDGVSWTNYTNSNSGLVDNTINTNAMTIDKKGNVWVGTSSRQTLKGTGVSRFDGTKWQAYTENDGLVYNNVMAIATDENGAIWFGTNYGISKYDGLSWKSYTAGNTYNLVNSANFILPDTKGVIWFSSYPGGLLKYDGENWSSFDLKNSGLADGVITSIVKDKLNNIWVSTEIGVSKFDGTNWLNYTCNNGSILFYIKSMVIDSKGVKWLATSDFKLFELEE